ncbi:glycosyl transferase [Asanoa ishikariensis]|uniref:Glycosyltransferase involved in cell wall bisynthesis n=1 Tax=Asanoa ishikariensis TaxID=137265 RepID=A0A1H3S9E9_9ACTN|nr:glycosyltransferase [Asanoa ishikariensis]GIF70292.1 glycosyl transferase [Asanoa ishikariensis]SDZ34310.1 Glycosyltransferase involved in cell wall bisynthesis [Asanoa ishikariensis]
MRIAMISEHADPSDGAASGGRGAFVGDLSAALADAGHEVRVYTRKVAANEADATVGGVSVIRVPAGPARPLDDGELLPYTKDFSRFLVDRWRGDGWTPAVAHAHFWTSGLAAITAGKQTGVPVVESYHELASAARRGDAFSGPPQRIGYERVLGRAVDRVVAQSQDELRELVRMGVPRSHLVLIPGGVDDELFQPEGPARDRGPRRRVLSVGALTARKGHEDVISALRLVPDAECVVVGGPPAESLDTDPAARELRELADRYDVGDRVRLVGRVPRLEMPLWYRSADLLVAAPWYEPFGLSPLEAMACGVPVIGTAVGGIAETVVEGLTGDLVPVRDPRALGTAIRHLLGDPVRHLAYATAAIDRARQVYSWKRVAGQLAAVYTTLSGLHTRPSGAVA